VIALWRRRQDLQRPPCGETRDRSLKASTGFEPVIRVLQTLALPLGHDAIKNQSGRWDSNPRPSPWQGDVLPLNYTRESWPFLQAESAESQNRTDDTAIFSRVLYQLSYLGQLFGC
jgi:hypothetical protein